MRLIRRVRHQLTRSHYLLRKSDYQVVICTPKRRRAQRKRTARFFLQSGSADWTELTYTQYINLPEHLASLNNTEETS